MSSKGNERALSTALELTNVAVWRQRPPKRTPLVFGFAAPRGQVNGCVTWQFVCFAPLICENERFAAIRLVTGPKSGRSSKQAVDSAAEKGPYSLLFTISSYFLVYLANGAVAPFSTVDLGFLSMDFICNQGKGPLLVVPYGTELVMKSNRHHLPLWVVLKRCSRFSKRARASTSLQQARVCSIIDHIAFCVNFIWSLLV